MNEKKNIIVLQDINTGNGYIHLINDSELEKFNKMFEEDQKGDDRLFNNGYSVVGTFNIDTLKNFSMIEDFSAIEEYFR